MERERCELGKRSKMVPYVITVRVREVIRLGMVMGRASEAIRQR